MSTTIRAARPFLVRASVWAILALAGLVTATTVAAEIDDGEGALFRTVQAAGALVTLVSGVAAARAASGAIKASTADRMDRAHAAPLAQVASIAGYIVVVLAVLDALGVPLQGLLLGGAVTGVAIGIAAQQTLANFFAGIVLLLVRPITLGEEVVLRSGPLGGEYEGTVTDMGLFYVSMATARGPLALPNAGVLTAAIGPGARSVDAIDAENQG